MRSYLFRKHVTAALSQRKYSAYDQSSSLSKPFRPPRSRTASPSPGRKSSQMRSQLALFRAKSKLFTYIKAKFPYGIRDLLEQCKAAINTQDERGNTALYYASQSNNLPLAEALLQSGARADTRNSGNNTALHVAMQRNERAIASLLMAYRADIHAVNLQGATPLMLAPGRLLQDLGLSHVPLWSEASSAGKSHNSEK